MVRVRTAAKVQHRATPSKDHGFVCIGGYTGYWRPQKYQWKAENKLFLMMYLVHTLE